MRSLAAARDTVLFTLPRPTGTRESAVI